MKLDKIYILLFISFIILPTILFMTIGSTTENTENRTTTVFPKYENITLDEYISLLDTYYTDNIPYKSDIVNFQKNLKINLFNEVDDNKVILGDDEWLFYKGDNGVSSIQDYMGITRFSEYELNTHIQIYKNLQEICSRNEIQLIILIGPNKERVYSKYMPEKYNIINESNATDQLVSALNQEDIAVIYPLKDLKVYNENLTYYKYDTHWNDLGAFITSQLVLEKLKLPTMSISEVKITSSPRIGGDLANMLAMGNDFTQDITYSINYKQNVIPQEVKRKSTTSPIPYTKYECSETENKSNLFYYGDSYATAIKPFLSKNFNFSTFLHRNDIANEFIVPKAGDVIILETVERYSKSLAVDTQTLINLLISN